MYMQARREAVGGMPIGTSGRGMVMLSGGIDSPVAAYAMAKRGMTITAMHFMSPALYRAGGTAKGGGFNPPPG